MSKGPHAAAEAGFPDAFVARCLDDALAHGARVYGISGLQGSGKSTLAAQLARLAGECGIRAVVLSLDDAYLDHDERARLARDVHPLLATRGPPGTHDMALATRTLDALRAGEPVALPRFDKLADSKRPGSEWPRADNVELVLFEGWFLGAPPEPDAALADPVNALERDEDPDGRWRRWCNDALARDYPALWRRIDRLLFLQGPGFDIVPRWRWQQEQSLQAGHPDRKAMTRAQVERFVQFFERTSRQAMRTLPGMADTVAPLDGERRPL
ncbi:kinase [Luteimonas lutimaris]|uniref:Kinase n=1 Tax=Luteimonas lutimaris TaxID=698645 RepID=A0ABP7MZ31_9GAMM